MRIHLTIKTGRDIIPFDHQHLMVGTIHKWLGKNELHGSPALFSFSRLSEAKAGKNGLTFNGVSSFFISACHNDIITRLVNGIMKDRTMFHGLEVSEINLQEDPDLTNRDIFYPASPILIKRPFETGTKHYIYTDGNSAELLKETLCHKMKIAGMTPDDSLEISFATDYPRASTKLVNYNGIKNKASWCPVIIKGKSETKLFAWNVGLGNSTGIGFGALK